MMTRVSTEPRRRRARDAWALASPLPRRRTRTRTPSAAPIASSWLAPRRRTWARRPRYAPRSRRYSSLRPWRSSRDGPWRIPWPGAAGRAPVVVAPGGAHCDSRLVSEPPRGGDMTVGREADDDPRGNIRPGHSRRAKRTSRTHARAHERRGSRDVAVERGERRCARRGRLGDRARTRERAVRKSLEMGRSRSRASPLDATPRRRRCGAVRGEHLRLQLARGRELGRCRRGPRAPTQVSRGRG